MDELIARCDQAPARSTSLLARSPPLKKQTLLQEPPLVARLGRGVAATAAAARTERD